MRVLIVNVCVLLMCLTREVGGWRFVRRTRFRFRALTVNRIVIVIVGVSLCEQAFLGEGL